MGEKKKSKHESLINRRDALKVAGFTLTGGTGTGTNSIYIPVALPVHNRLLAGPTYGRVPRGRAALVYLERV